MKIEWYESAWEEYLTWQYEDKKTIKKINSLVKDLQRNGIKGLGKPEPLKNNFDGWFSKRINDKDRLVFKIDNGLLIIASCKGHYDDK
ncbi:MAG: Txe/YoeB family addiction module toxin [Lachnospiraceae bacterium]|nr:Txe/YoeB family addiction module toxin [Lachnospiraceae bacterium]